MNQDQVRGILVAVRPVSDIEFTVIFSGKQSKKVNGLFHPQTKEIVIHNRNFEDDRLLMYTAFHEYAHLLQFLAEGKTGHNKQFWAIFNALLDLAIEMKVWERPALPVDLAKEVEETKDLLKQHAALEARIGSKINDLNKLSLRYGQRVEEIIDRDLRIDRRTAKRFENAAVNYNLFDDEEYLNCSMVSAVAHTPKRDKQEMVELLTDDSTTNVYTPVVPVSPIISPNLDDEDDEKKEKLAYVRLAKKRDRLDRTIGKLTEERIKVEHQMETIVAQDNDQAAAADVPRKGELL